MKSTFGKIAIVIILLWAFLLGLSCMYDFALLHNKNLKPSYVSENAINAEVLLHGPCQPLWIVQPEIIERQTGLKTYNLGLSHADFAENYLLLHLYLKKNKAPKYLFLYVSPESMDLNYNPFSAYRFAPFLNDTLVVQVLKECDNAYFKWTSIPFMKYAYYSNAVNFDVIQGLLHYVADKPLPYYPDGFEPPFSFDKKHSPAFYVQIYPGKYHFGWDSLREKYLRKTIALAQEKRIQVFLYESPLLKSALKNIDNRKETIDKIKMLANENRVRFLQFENMSIADSVEDFLTTVVTTVEGGRIFSDTLAKVIIDLEKK